MGLIENKTLTPYYDVLGPKGKSWLKRALALKAQKVNYSTVQQIMAILFP